jgi:glycine hydroxymethyltransferase
MGEAEFDTIAHRIADVLDNIQDSALHANIQKEMTQLARKFVIYDRPIY